MASLTPLLLLAWPAVRTSLNVGDVGDTLLQVGLVLLAAGLVVGAAAGGAALLGALATGVVVGVFGLLATAELVVQRDLPVLAVVVALAAVPIGFLAAMSPLRLRFGVGGLLVVAAGLAVLFLVLSAESPLGTDDAVVRVIEPVLVLAAGVGVTAGIATAGARLAERATAPAVLAGLATPFALGTLSVMAHVVVSGTAADGDLPETPLLLAVAGLCVAAVALMGIAGRLGRRPGAETGTPVAVSSDIT